LPLGGVSKTGQGRGRGGSAIVDYPQKFGEYLLLERLSQGGMAVVFRVKSFGISGFQKFFALKRMLPSLAEDPDFVTMFIDEAKIAAGLEHGNICHIYEFGRLDDFLYQVMEYIDGLDLRRMSRKLNKKGQRLSVAMVIYIMARACEGLDYAHRKADAQGRHLEIIHRDISPQNIMVSYEGVVKVIDFGVAKARSRMSHTDAGIIKGKFAYVPPELVLGEDGDHRCDIYSMGVVLWELLTGERLFVRDNELETLRAVTQGDVKPPSLVAPDIPSNVEEVILRALALDPDDRQQSAEELQVDLDRCLLQGDVTMNAYVLRQFLGTHFAQAIEKERKRQRYFATLDAEGCVAEPGRSTGDDEGEGSGSFSGVSGGSRGGNSEISSHGGTGSSVGTSSRRVAAAPPPAEPEDPRATADLRGAAALVQKHLEQQRGHDVFKDDRESSAEVGAVSLGEEDILQVYAYDEYEEQDRASQEPTSQVFTGAAGLEAAAATAATDSPFHGGMGREDLADFYPVGDGDDEVDATIFDNHQPGRERAFPAPEGRFAPTDAVPPNFETFDDVPDEGVMAIPTRAECPTVENLTDNRPTQPNQDGPGSDD
jgi:serine/threonine protein kinase